jgi:Mg2+-importing ATPase
VDDDFVAKPRNWSARSILKFMLVMGPVSSIFDIVSFVIMYYGLGWGHNNNDTIINFQTGWFLVSLLTQTLVIIILRTMHVPLFKSYPSMSLSLSLIILVIIGFALVLTPNLQPVFGSLASVKNGYEFIGFSLAIAACYSLSAQFTKMGYVKIFRSWL